MLSNPWIGIAIVASLLAAMVVALRALRARHAIEPELSRKAAHVGLGLATLSFPLLFDEVWPVALLAAVTLVVLAAMRWVPLVYAGFGGIVHGVERRSSGDLCYPIAAAGLFVLAEGDPILFGIPILTLAVADAVAALVGVYYGRIRYETGEARKSLEGSVAFFTVAFLATHIPLLLLTETGRLESVLVGLIFGILVMLVEAVSLRGTDNLLVPFGGYFLLEGFLRRSAPELAVALAVTVLLLGLVLVLRKRRTLSDAAVLAAVLVGFVAWAVGGWRWLVPPLAVFLSYTVLWPRRGQVRHRPHDLVAIGSAVSAGLVWLLLAHVLARPELFYPYTIAFAASLCFIGITWHRLARPRLHPAVVIARSAVASWLVVFAAYAAVTGPGAGALVSSAAALGCLLAGGAVFTRAIPARDDHGHPFPWVRQSLVGLAASALGLLPLALGGAS